MADVLNTGAHTAEQQGDHLEAPEGHDAEMIAKVDAKEAELASIGNGAEAPKETPKEAPAEKEELLLGKFKSADDLAKAYQELERKLSKGGAEEAPKEAPKEVTDKQANDAVKEAGLDMATLSAHYDANGGALGDDDYEALEKAGIPRSYVDTYIEGLEAKGAQLQAEIFSSVGGEEQFKTMAQWAANSMTPKELENYNNSVNSRDPATIRSAVMSLAYQYERAVGRDPKLITGNKASNSSNSFGSVAQLTEAMKDPRYEKDPAYRREVEQRLANSNIL